MSKKISEIPYLKIMEKAFSVTWKNRYLWWYGFFLLLSSIGGLDYSRGDFDLKVTQPNFALENLSRHSHWIFIGVLFLLIILIALIILSIISRGALISSIEKIHKNKNTNFKTAFCDGKKNFNKIFLISIFSGLFIFGALLILFPPLAFLFLNHNYLIGTLMAAIALIIFIPLVILTSYLRIFGYLYAVLGSLKSWTSIENAYNLFRKNISTSLLMAVIFIPLNILLFLAILFALVPIALAIFPLGIVLFVFAGPFGAGITGAIGLAILAILFIYLRSFMEVFTEAAWIFFFHEIAAPKEKEVVAETITEIEQLPNPLPTINSEVK